MIEDLDHLVSIVCNVLVHMEQEPGAVRKFGRRDIMDLSSPIVQERHSFEQPSRDELICCRSKQLADHEKACKA
jgi:hypothetical protein